MCNKSKHIHTLGVGNSTPRKSYVSSPKYLYKIFIAALFLIAKILETVQIATIGGMDKMVTQQNVLWQKKKKGTISICNNVVEFHQKKR